MKKAVLIPIIIGSALLVTCGTLFVVGLVTSRAMSKPVEKTVKFEQEFKDFNIDISTSSLEFKFTEGDAKVELKETEKVFHDVTIKDGVLSIKQTDDLPWYNKIFGFSSTNEMSVTIYLPLHEYDDLVINTSTGSTKIPNDFSFNSLKLDKSTGSAEIKSNVVGATYIESSTGSTKLSDLSTKELTVKASTGSVALENVKVEEKIFVKTSTGSQKLKNVSGKELELSASTGSVKLENTLIASNVIIGTSTGSIDFENCDCETAKISASTGHVKGTFLTSKIVYAESDTGSISVPHSKEGGVLEIKTSTGSINIKIKE